MWTLISNDEQAAGTLHVVATPIGNLDDISRRALAVLRQVDAVAAEDTRRAGKLLGRHSISNTLHSYHDHNKDRSASRLLNLLSDGADIALISEAGTPTISDPGFYLVRRALAAGLKVVAVPGPCAAVAALSVSGLPSERFLFAGFAPRGDDLLNFLSEAELLGCSVILYESPKRVIQTLGAVRQVLGDRTVSVSRELTKIYEETLAGPVDEVLQRLQDSDSLRGEFTLIIAPAGYSLRPPEDRRPKTAGPALISRPEGDSDIDDVVLKQVNILVDGGYRLSEAVRCVARGHDIPRSKLYNAFLDYFPNN